MKAIFNSMIRPLLLLAALALPGGHANAQAPNADIYGTWKFKTLIGGGIGSLTDRQARQLIGKRLVISADRFEFNGRVCLHPTYQRSQESSHTYFDREWRTNVNGIPFPNPVTIIETTSCDYLYPIRKGLLMFAEDCGFFEAVRVRSAPRRPDQVSKQIAGRSQK